VDSFSTFLQEKSNIMITWDKLSSFLTTLEHIYWHTILIFGCYLIENLRQFEETLFLMSSMQSDMYIQRTTEKQVNNIYAI